MIDTRQGALKIIIASLLWFSILGCSSPRATVHIMYRPPENASGSCLVKRTHIPPGWQRSTYTFMNWRKKTGQWVYTSRVPVGKEQSFRINDPAACDRNETGAITEGITANGVPLSRVVSTPTSGAGTGPEPGLAFTVDRHGQVIP